MKLKLTHNSKLDKRISLTNEGRRITMPVDGFAYWYAERVEQNKADHSVPAQQKNKKAALPIQTAQVKLEHERKASPSPIIPIQPKPLAITRNTMLAAAPKATSPDVASNPVPRRKTMLPGGPKRHPAHTRKKSPKLAVIEEANANSNTTKRTIDVPHPIASELLPKDSEIVVVRRTQGFAKSKEGLLALTKKPIVCVEPVTLIDEPASLPIVALKPPAPVVDESDQLMQAYYKKLQTKAAKARAEEEEKQAEARAKAHEELLKYEASIKNFTAQVPDDKAEAVQQNRQIKNIPNPPEFSSSKKWIVIGTCMAVAGVLSAPITFGVSLVLGVIGTVLAGIGSILGLVSGGKYLWDCHHYKNQMQNYVSNNYTKSKSYINVGLSYGQAYFYQNTFERIGFVKRNNGTFEVFYKANVYDNYKVIEEYSDLANALKKINELQIEELKHQANFVASQPIPIPAPRVKEVVPSMLSVSVSSSPVTTFGSVAKNPSPPRVDKEVLERLRARAESTASQFKR